MSSISGTGGVPPFPPPSLGGNENIPGLPGGLLPESNPFVKWCKEHFPNASPLQLRLMATQMNQLILKMISQEMSREARLSRERRKRDQRMIEDKE